MPEQEIKVKRESAQTVYISHPDYSYGIFCFNESGDLFLNSDWGMYGYAWRHYGGDFKKFLSGLNAPYVYDKFDSNTRYLFSKGLPKHTRKPVEALLQAFFDELKKEVTL